MSGVIEIKGGGLNLRLEHANFKESEVQKIREAAEHAHEALNSPEFKEFCLNFSYSYRTYRRRWFRKIYSNDIARDFKENDGKTREEVFNHLMTGEETLRPGKDQEIDITLILDKRNKRGVLGYTYANSTKQWIYNWFFRSGDVNDVAGNIVHEWCHKMGYGHAYRYNYTRQFTVPYAVGYFVRDYVRVKDR